MGLGQYGVLSRQWLSSGQTLVLATPQDLEKEMGLKNPLHRKKLQLAVKMRGSKQVEKSAELDHIWVTRWLDDIGLPQYKDQFHEGRVDGHMLQYLTVKTLLRRHLASNFGSLVGGQAQQEKKEYMEVAGYTPLSTTAKIRPKKLVFSNLAHLRRRRPGDSTDYICPLDSPPPASLPLPSSSTASSSTASSSIASSASTAISQPTANGSPVPSYASFRGLSPILDREPPGPHGGQQVGPDDS
ncbi:hypothetical protein CRUP_038808 [Coryphaenoides rupestris]|nr:hypothetical protein CRUP_038808 [Coryphaenoides rupestris]